MAVLPDPEKVSPHRDRVPSADKAETENSTQVAEGLVQLDTGQNRLQPRSWFERIQPEYPEIARQERRSYFAAQRE